MKSLLFAFSVLAASLLPKPDFLSRPLSESDAKALVFASLPVSVSKLPGVSIEPGHAEGRFDYFTVTWAQTLAEGSVVAGNYAVDLRTGDVFSSVIGCDELHTLKLRKLQRRIRAQLGLSWNRYRKLKSAGPLCDVSVRPGQDARFVAR